MSDMHVVRPDILDCLANLSSDEVFTPPKIVNEMLDLLPRELWSNPNARFCDPFTKSGVFLREIVKRLDKGLEKIIPDKDARIKHIFRTQVFGIAITQLTALFSRRSLYCNKDVTSERSTAQDIFTSSGGNIIFTPCKHTWVKDSCKICGASRKALSESKEVENYAYPFLHSEAIMKNSQELGFDVVIGNPPYQMSDGGGGGGSSASPLYHFFVDRAKKLNPLHLVMIIPSRWFTGGKGLNEFRDEMLHDRQLVELHDYPDEKEVFPGVEIKGGVCYFHWQRGACQDAKIVQHMKGIEYESIRPMLKPGIDSYVRFNQAVSIVDKVLSYNESSFRSLVSARKPFGLDSKFRGGSSGEVVIYQNKSVAKVQLNDIPQNRDFVDKWKVMISFAYGAGSDFPHQILGKPFVAAPGTCCTETYLVLGPWKSKLEAENVVTYIKTRFFRFMVMQLKYTQNGTSQVYEFVPMQDFSKPWTDEELYEKYGITKEEQEFIESMIRPMKQEDDK